MRGSSRPALILLAICALVYALYLHGRRMSPAYPDVVARTEGGFTLGGQYVGEPLAHAALRCWGSWSGADANEGSLTIGPFTAPPRLRFGVTGFPLQKGIELFV